MLSNLRIKNFRMLVDLNISKLGRVNLIVGKNNSGKSTILEALRIYAGNANPSLLREILAIHDESFNLDETRGFESDGQSWGAIKHLFPNRELPTAENTLLTIGTGKNKTLSIEYVFYYVDTEEITNDEGEVFDIKRKRVFVSRSELSTVTETQEVTPAIRLRNGLRTALIDLTDDMRRTKTSSLILGGVGSSILNCSYVPTEFLTSEALATLWDKIALSSKEGVVLDALKIIDESLERLTFIEDPNKASSRDNSRLPIVTLKDSDKRIPLNSMGDGMSRILQLILSVFPAKDGILLIDEFENGLHFSVQEEVWKIIFKLAKELNIQVFATTHSWDCIESFTKVAIESPEEGILLKVSKSKLVSDNGKVIATVYSEKELATITATELEVR